MTGTAATSAAVIAALAEARDPERAAGNARYFKTGPGEYGEGDQFLGVTVPQVRTIVRRFAELPDSELTVLLNSPWHEHRLTALLIMVAQFVREGSGAHPDEERQRRLHERYLLEVRKGSVNNWDLVDSSAEQLVGRWLTDRPRDILHELAISENLWERRVAIIATLAFVKQGDASTSLAVATILLGDPEPLLHKAVGWVLREIGKRVDRAVLTEFLDQNAGRMPRTMLSYATEHLTPEERARYRAVPRLR